MIAIREYVDREGRSPYARWFNRLSAQAAAKVATALIKLKQENLSGVKGSALANASISARMAMH